MNRSFFAVILIAAVWRFAPGSLLAQGNFISPEIHRDRSVTFRLHAPNAREVLVQGIPGQGSITMNKGEEGIWSAKVGPLEPEIYSYTFGVDGATVLDPRNRHVKEWLRSESMFHIPGDPPLLHDRQDVPQGTLHFHHYTSPAVSGLRPVVIYTPPNYSTGSIWRYPVLYLMHGFGDDHTAWTDVGRAGTIADNLLAQGKIQRMIIVMPNGHPLPLSTGRPDNYGSQNRDLLRKDYFEALMPFVQKHYQVKSGSEDKAIAGLSMGGGQALDIGLSNLDAFGWIGAFSSAAPSDDLDAVFAPLLDDINRTNRRIHLLWIGCGRDDFLLERNQDFVAWLNSHNIEHTWRLTDGGHSWPVWRHYLADFLPLLFE